MDSIKYDWWHKKRWSSIEEIVNAFEGIESIGQIAVLCAAPGVIFDHVCGKIPQNEFITHYDHSRTISTNKVEIAFFQCDQTEAFFRIGAESTVILELDSMLTYEPNAYWDSLGWIDPDLY